MEFLNQLQIPDCVISSYQQTKLKKVFPWQIECLQQPGVIEGQRNLVYSAPTGAGKTFVAEILMLKQILRHEKKAIFIQPFVSVAREKVFALKSLYEGTGIRVGGLIGGHRPIGGITSIDVIVCTIEKANNLINRMIESKSMNQFCFIGIDEIHMVSDNNRGYILELLLTKLMYLTKRSKFESLQIVGMSATIPNLNCISKWLEAEIYTTNFRPVPLSNYLLIGEKTYNDQLEEIKSNFIKFDFENDDDQITSLCYQTICDGHCVLVFCPTKSWCEKLATTIAKNLYLYHLKNKCPTILVSRVQKLCELFYQLKRTPSGLDDVLKLTIPYGVAYHHAGLTIEERDIIESGFRDCTIGVLVATSTLSSGVNLPARRVIIRTPKFHGKPIDIRMYHQMCGRAGRKGKDEAGESILVCKDQEKQIGFNVIKGKIPKVESCLFISPEDNETLTSSLKRLILEAIGNGLVSTFNDISKYIKCSLCYCLQTNQSDSQNVSLDDQLIEKCINWLVENEFIYLQTTASEKKVTPTQLGRAALLSSLPTSEALLVLADLQMASKAFALDSELHLVYQVTPIFVINQLSNIDWFNFMYIYQALSVAHRNAAKLIGISELFLVKMASSGGEISSSSEKQKRLLNIHVRFFASLILNDLINETSLNELCSKYKCNKGSIQNIQQSSAVFAGMITAFCEELGWWSLEILLKNFQARLIFGIQHELLDLSQIYLLDNVRARSLFKCNLKTCLDVCMSTIDEIELILINSTKFQSKNDQNAEGNINKIKVVGLNSPLTIHDAAVEIIKEAKKICKHEEEKSSYQSQLNSKSLSFSSPQAKVMKISKDSSKPQPTLLLLTEESTNKDKIKKNGSLEEQFKSPVSCNNSKMIKIKSKESPQTINNEESFINLSLSNSQLDSLLNEESGLNVTSLIPCEESTPISEPRNRRLSIKNRLEEEVMCSVISKSFLDDSDSFDLFEEKLKNDSEKWILEEELQRLEKISNGSFKSEEQTDRSLCVNSEVSPNNINVFDVGVSNDKFVNFCSKLESQKEFSMELYSIGKDIKAIFFSFSTDDIYFINLQSAKQPFNYLYEICEVLLKLPQSCFIFGHHLEEKLNNLFRHQHEVFSIKAKLFDAKLAFWMLNPDDTELSNHDMIETHISKKQNNYLESCEFFKELNNSFVVSSLSCIASFTACRLFHQKLNEKGLMKVFVDVEMPHAVAFSLLEENGLIVDVVLLKNYKLKLLRAMYELEQAAWKIVGRKFNLNSTVTTSKIIFEELKLTSKDCEKLEAKDLLKQLRRPQKRKYKSANKQTLETIHKTSNHPFPKIITDWRSAHHAIYQCLIPLEKYLSSLKTTLFKPPSFSFSCTGRMLMEEPNIQKFPRLFDVSLGLNSQLSSNGRFTINLRELFIADKTFNRVFISADFSQLELRILAHFSQDEKLLKVFNENSEDIFCKMARGLKTCKNQTISVTDVERQHAKKICYGILYGMSSLTLSKQLSIDKESAETLMNNFLIYFSALRPTLNKIIEKCRIDGFVTTVLGRHRYLPNINSEMNHLRCQAERQAVNSTIQGSAADIIKLATCRITQDLLVKDFKIIRTNIKSKCCYYVNHMHDELMFETDLSSLKQVASIIRHHMIHALDLKVKLDVKIKVGPSWGSLKEYSQSQY